MSIEVKDILKVYGKQKALNKVNFAMQSGEIVGFLGPNGAGKSTMMKILTTYLTQNEGIVIVNGYDTLTNPLDVMPPSTIKSLKLISLSFSIAPITSFI